MDIKTADLSPTEWHEQYNKIFKELELFREPDDFFDDDDDDDDNDDDDDDDDNDNDNDYDDNDDDNDDNDDDDYDYDDANDDNTDDDDGYFCNYRKIGNQQQALYDLCMTRMAPLFASQPRLKKICNDLDNRFLSSCFSEYILSKYKNDSASEFHERVNDMEYLINLCGTNLTELNVNHYCTSQIMPIINANCPNLDTLDTRFNEIMSQDFENVFSNMSRLTTLRIKWQSNNLTLPMTLVKSLEQVGGTLTSLSLTSTIKPKNISLPDSLALVFPQLIALESLNIYGFGLSQLLLQSIGQMKNLISLTLMSHYWRKNNPTFDTRTSMYPIGNLKNLEELQISCDYGIRDEFLINLANNAKKLRKLHIIGTDITDIGISAIDNLEQLEQLDLGLSFQSQGNKYITDESIGCLFNPKLSWLDLSYCINITNKSLMKLFKNLPNLEDLSVTKTKVTRKAGKKLNKLTSRLMIYY